MTKDKKRQKCYTCNKKCNSYFCSSGCSEKYFWSRVKQLQVEVLP